MNATKITAEPGQPFVDVVREFDAPRELVYQAHVDPALVVEWLGPARFAIPALLTDSLTAAARQIRAGDGAVARPFRVPRMSASRETPTAMPTRGRRSDTCARSPWEARRTRHLSRGRASAARSERRVAGGIMGRWRSRPTISPTPTTSAAATSCPRSGSATSGRSPRARSTGSWPGWRRRVSFGPANEGPATGGRTR